MTSHCSTDYSVLDRRVHQLICIYHAEFPTTEAFCNITQRLIRAKLSEVAFKLIIFYLFKCCSSFPCIYWYSQYSTQITLVAQHISNIHRWERYWLQCLRATLTEKPVVGLFWKVKGNTFSFHEDGFQVHKASLVLQQALMKLRNKQQHANREGVWEKLSHLLAGEDMSMEFHSSSKTCISR